MKFSLRFNITSFFILCQKIDKTNCSFRKFKHFSTSPEQEPPEFVANLKESFKMMIAHPNPYTTYFRNGRPNVYTKQIDGSWKLDN